MPETYPHNNQAIRRLSITDKDFDKIGENKSFDRKPSIPVISESVNNIYKSNNKVVPIQYKSPELSSQTQGFEVLWHNLSCSLYRQPFLQRGKFNILKKLNGHFKSNEIVAIMGPSGAGKSTLLEIICGRRTQGVKGEVRIRGVDGIKIGFVPQDNYLLELLTVRETFIFASELINRSLSLNDHRIIAEKIISRFSLEPITNTRINRCSGGQRKRLSIALEVISKPQILILDEPTTGLDSPSCTHVMKIFDELASDESHKMAIVTTIHQPSVSLFNKFHRIYVLSAKGKCIYHGEPSKLVDTLNSVGLSCDVHTSPSDYIIEIAAGDYGQLPIDKLNSEAVAKDMESLVLTNTKTLKSVSRLDSHPFFEHFRILFIRSQIILYRDPFLTVLRVIMTVFSAVSLCIMFGRQIGVVSGCAPRELELYATPVHILSLKFENDINAIMQNVCLMFLGIMVGFISGLAPTLLNFPKEMHVFYKEYHNGWYSCITYYLAKMVSDIPMQVSTPVLYILITYFYTNQPLEPFRFFALITISVILSLLAQSIGECVSAIWMEKPNTAVFFGGFIPLPMILFGGFLVKISRMPFYLRPISWFSFLRYSFEAMMISIYGFDRCEYNYQQFLQTVNVSAITVPLWAQSMPIMIHYLDMKRGLESEDFDAYPVEVQRAKSLKRLLKVFGGGLLENQEEIDFNQSMILGYYELSDNYLFTAIVILLFWMAFIKVSTYYVLLAKLHSTK